MLFDLLGYLIPACIVIGVCEMLSEMLWWRTYFTFGIPVFTRTIRVTSAIVKGPRADDIEEYGLPDNPGDTSIVAKELDTNRFGIRFHKGGLRRYCSVLHGFVFFDQANRRIVVKAFADWSALAFASVALAFFLMAIKDAHDLTFAAPAVIILLVLLNTYSKECKRLHELADILERLWS